MSNRGSPLFRIDGVGNDGEDYFAIDVAGGDVLPGLGGGAERVGFGDVGLELAGFDEGCEPLEGFAGAVGRKEEGVDAVLLGIGRRWGLRDGDEVAAGLENGVGALLDFAADGVENGIDVGGGGFEGGGLVVEDLIGAIAAQAVETGGGAGSYDARAAYF